MTACVGVGTASFLRLIDTRADAVARAAEAARGAGGAAEPRDYARDARALRRMHAESCAARIRDWREIRHRFAGTTAYRACGLLDALAKHRPDEGAANPD